MLHGDCSGKSAFISQPCKPAMAQMQRCNFVVLTYAVIMIIYMAAFLGFTPVLRLRKTSGFR